MLSLRINNVIYPAVSKKFIVGAITSKNKEEAIDLRDLTEKITDFFGYESTPQKTLLGALYDLFRTHQDTLTINTDANGAELALFPTAKSDDIGPLLDFVEKFHSIVEDHGLLQKLAYELSPVIRVCKNPFGLRLWLFDQKLMWIDYRGDLSSDQKEHFKSCCCPLILV